MFTLVHYLNFVFILILASRSVFGLEALPYENLRWQRLLYFENNKFKSFLDNFYVSKKENRTLKSEWNESVIAIKEGRLVGHLQKPFQCAFPARFEFIKKYEPSLKEIECPDFEKFQKSIDAKSLYVVYTSSYVSNPASMFGHTFIRLSRGGVTKVDALRDYSVGFMAITGNDNPISYTVKGLTGGYMGHLDIKPFYMNLSLYQNAEDRDLWQYKLDLDQNHVNSFVKSLWEVSQNTGFYYYFLDENCSSTLLKILETTDENLHLIDDKFYLFAHPIETLKWMKKSLVTDSVIFHKSTNKILRARFDKMTSRELQLYKKALKDEDIIDILNTPTVLDALIDYWKFKVYEKNSKLSEQEQRLYDKTLIKRSKIKERGVKIDEKIESSKNPLQFHDPNYFGFGYTYTKKSKGDLTLKNKIAYHDLLDNSLGHDGYSFIDIFSFQLNFNQSSDKIKIDNLNLVEITSFTPYYSVMPRYSWRLKLQYLDQYYFTNKKSTLFEVAIGLANIKSTSSFAQILVASFIGVENSLSDKYEFTPYVELLARLQMSSSIFVSRLKTTLFNGEFYYAPTLEMSKSLGARSIVRSSIEYRSFDRDEIYKLELGINY